MTNRIIIFAILAVSAHAQTTWERYILIQPDPGESTSNVWTLAWSDRTNAPQWWTWANERGLTNATIPALPCLIDSEGWQGVTVTGTIDNAINDLDGHDAAQRPARRALRKAIRAQLGNNTLKVNKHTIEQATLSARAGCATATTYAIHRVAATNELHLLRLINNFNDEKDETP